MKQWCVLLIGMVIVMFTSVETTQALISQESNPSFDESCKDNICTLTLFSGVRNVFEDNIWKKVEDAKSLKNKSGINLNIIQDVNFPVDVVDFNYTSIKLRLGVSDAKANKFIPIEVRDKYNKSNLVTDKNKEVKQGVFKLNTKNDVIDYELSLFDTNTSIFGVNIKWGDTSTTIELKEANTQNLKDSWTTRLDDPNGNHGADTTLNTDAARNWHIYITFNYSVIPNNSEIIESDLFLYDVNDENTLLDIHHVYADENWTENLVTHNNQPCGSLFDVSANCNLTIETKLQTNGVINNWNKINVTNMTKRDSARNDRGNLTIFIRDNTGTADQTYFNSKEHSNISTRPILNITYRLPAPNITLINPKNNTDLLFKNRPFIFNLSITSLTYNVLNATIWWNVSGIWQQNVSNRSRLTIGTGTNTSIYANLSRGYFVWNIQSCNVNGNCDFSNNNFTIRINNTIPSASSTTINNSIPINTDDLQCDNGSISDNDNDLSIVDTITLLYNWTKNSVDQAINTKTLSNTLTSVGDTWQCKITPFDGFTNGSTLTSASVVINGVNQAPIINFTNVTPTVAEVSKGEWLNLSVNFTDLNNDELHTAYFCSSDSATSSGCTLSAWCASLINTTGNFTSCRLNITDIDTFPLDVINEVYSFIVDNTTLISSSQLKTFSIRDITAPTILSYNFSLFSVVQNSKLNITINVSDNSSGLKQISFNLTNPNKVVLQRIFTTGSLGSNTSLVTFSSLSTNLRNYILNYTIFESSETSIVGIWNLTDITITDNKNNIVELHPNITFQVNSAPGGGSGGGGGGGGGGTIFTVVNATNETIIITETCNRNNICEGGFGEDFINCPSDCRFSVKSFTCDDPSVPCIFKNALIARIVMLLLLPISLFFIILPPEQRKRMKDLIFAKKKGSLYISKNKRFIKR